MNNIENELLNYKVIIVARIFKLSCLTGISLNDILEIKQEYWTMDEYDNFYLEYFNYDKFEYKTYLLNDGLFDLVSDAGCDSFTAFGEEVKYLFAKDKDQPFNLSEFNNVVNQMQRNDYLDIVV